MRAEMTALSLAAITATGSAILGGVVAAIALSAAARDIYLRTLGRRRDRYRRLRRLGTEAQPDFFAAVLGEPPAVRRTITKTDFLEYLGSGDPGYDPDSPEVQTREVSRDLTECFFIDRDYYVQTISDADETVSHTRSPRVPGASDHDWRYHPGLRLAVAGGPRGGGVVRAGRS
jgi:hypothetical protein